MRSAKRQRILVAGDEDALDDATLQGFLFSRLGHVKEEEVASSSASGGVHAVKFEEEVENAAVEEATSSLVEVKTMAEADEAAGMEVNTFAVDQAAVEVVKSAFVDATSSLVDDTNMADGDVAAGMVVMSMEPAVEGVANMKSPSPLTPSTPTPKDEVVEEVVRLAAAVHEAASSTPVAPITPPCGSPNRHRHLR